MYRIEKVCYVPASPLAAPHIKFIKRSVLPRANEAHCRPPRDAMPMKGSKSGSDQSVGAVNERKKINARVLKRVDEVYKAFHGTE